MMDKSLEKTVQNLIGEQFSSSSEEFAYVVARMSEDFWQVFHVDGFFELDIDTIYQILSNKDLRVSTMLDVFKVALKWIDHIPERWQHVARVMACIRFRCMTHKELLQCYEIIGSLEKYKSREIFQHVKDAITSAIRNQVGGDAVSELSACFPEKQQQPQETEQQPRETEQQPHETKQQPQETEQQPKETAAPSFFKNSCIGRIRKWLGWEKPHTRIFGQSLEGLMCDAPYGTVLPFVVTRICEDIRSKGFDHEKLFSEKLRSGNVELWKLEDQFDTYGDADLKEADVTTVGQLLFSFLRNMNDPVIPRYVMQRFSTVLDTYKNNVPVYAFHLRQVVNQLERDRYTLLKYLIRFMVEAAKSSKKTPAVLAGAFAPKLFRCSQSLYPLINRIVADLMEYHVAIFEDENPSIFKLSPDPCSTWFHGALPRKDAHRLLKNNGDFLVRKKLRKTSEPQYILSMHLNGKRDFKIRYKYDVWRLNDQSFQTLQELVHYHCSIGQSVSKKFNAVLKKAIECKEDKITLEEMVVPAALSTQTEASNAPRSSASLTLVGSQPIAFTREQFIYQYSKSY